MSEHVERLRETLVELHDELAAVDSPDPDTRKLIEDAKAEMDGALHRDEPESLEPHTLSEQLREAVQQFDESHPTLTRVVGNVLDVLGQMGI